MTTFILIAALCLIFTAKSFFMSVLSKKHLRDTPEDLEKLEEKDVLLFGTYPKEKAKRSTRRSAPLVLRSALKALRGITS